MAQCAPPFILKLVKDVVYFKRYTNLQVDAVSEKKYIKLYLIGFEITVSVLKWENNSIHTVGLVFTK
jgi:hypothetical protein